MSVRRVIMALLAAIALAPAAWRIFNRPSTTDIAVEPGTIVLRYMAWGNPEQLEVERDVIRRFNAQQKQEGSRYRVKLFMPPAGGYEQKLRVMLATGTAPDVIRADHYYFPALVRRGYFRDLSDLAERDRAAGTFDPEDFHPAAMHENYYQGRLYGLNVLFGGVICYYNKDLFARAGLEDPYTMWKRGEWTWEAFEKSAAALTERDASGRTIRYGFLLPGVAGGAPPHWAWFLWVWGSGGELLSPPEPGRPRRSLLDSPESIAAFTAMRDLRWKLRVAPTPSDQAASAFTFESGKIAMQFDFAGSAPRYRKIRDFRWDLVPTPARVVVRDGRREVIPYSVVKGNQLVVSATCPHPQAAWDWVKFMTSRETELYLYGDHHRRNVATHISLLKDPKTGGPGESLIAKQRPFQTDIFVSVLDNARELPIDQTWPMWTSEAGRYIERVMVNEDASVEQVLRVGARAVDRVVGRRGQWSVVSRTRR